MEQFNFTEEELLAYNECDVGVQFMDLRPGIENALTNFRVVNLDENNQDART